MSIAAPLTERQMTALRKLQQAHAAPSICTVLPLTRGDTHPPLFCVHPASGSGGCYQNLAHKLRCDRTIFALETAPLMDVNGLEPSIEDRAAAYVSTLRSVQSSGPYQITGYSMGSTIAFEIARQLRAAGHEIAFLGLIDGASPSMSRLTQDRDTALIVAGLARDCARAAGIELGLRHDELKRLRPAEVFDKIRLTLEAHQIYRPEMDPAMLQRFVNGMNARLRAIYDYYPQPYAGPAVFFRSSMREEESARAWADAGVDLSQRCKGWSSLFSGPFEIVEVDAFHSTLLDADAGKLASAMKPFLT